jgi:two-component system, OmpR family, phosphate regulon response regulator PhoB
VVVQRERDLTADVRARLEPLGDVTVEQADTRPSVAPAVGADVVVLDLGAIVPPGFEIVRILQPRDASPALVILRATSKDDAAEPGGSAGRLVAIESRLHGAVGRAPRASWRALRFRGAHLQADLPGTSVLVEGQRIRISAREGELLGILLTHVNRVVPRDVLLAEIWGFATRSLDVHIRRLRRKLGSAGAQIQTVPAFGYRFAEPGVTDDPSGSGERPPELLQRVHSHVTRF